MRGTHEEVRISVSDSVGRSFRDRAGLLPAGRLRPAERRSQLRGLRQRAEVGDQANEILRAMVAEVAATRPTDGSGQRAVALWVQDWASLQASRERQVAKWKSGIDEPFEEALSEKRAPISNRMGQFARGNRMDSCQPAGDMG